MVDITGIRQPFLFAVVFVAIFALLVTYGVSSAPLMFTESAEMNYYSMPDYFDAADIEDLATFHNITADNGGAYYSQDWGIDEGFGHNFLFEISEVSGYVKMANTHYFYWLIFPTGHHYMEWTARTNGENFGEFLTGDEIESVEVASGDLTTARFKVSCEHVYIHSTVAYNNTEYDNATQAFQNDALTVEFAINWDEVGTGLNAYALIAQIMTFQRPDVHPLLNSLIAIPLWALIGFIVVVIILAIIDALPFT